jgi:hypothetical protein
MVTHTYEISVLKILSSPLMCGARKGIPLKKKYYCLGRGVRKFTSLKVTRECPLILLVSEKVKD